MEKLTTHNGQLMYNLDYFKGKDIARTLDRELTLLDPNDFCSNNEFDEYWNNVSTEKQIVDATFDYLDSPDVQLNTPFLEELHRCFDERAGELDEEECNCRRMQDTDFDELHDEWLQDYHNDYCREDW